MEKSAFSIYLFVFLFFLFLLGNSHLAKPTFLFVLPSSHFYFYYFIFPSLLLFSFFFYCYRSDVDSCFVWIGQCVFLCPFLLLTATQFIEVANLYSNLDYNVNEFFVVVCLLNTD